MRPQREGKHAFRNVNRAVKMKIAIEDKEMQQSTKTYHHEEICLFLLLVPALRGGNLIALTPPPSPLLVLLRQLWIEGASDVSR